MVLLVHQARFFAVSLSLAILMLAPALAQVEPSSDEVPEIQILGVPEQFADCLKKNAKGKCVDEKKGTYQDLTHEVSESVEKRLDEIRSDFWESRLRLKIGFLGLRAGGARLKDHQVIEDPDKSKTEEKLTQGCGDSTEIETETCKPGLWIKHRLEVRPEFTASIIPKEIDESLTNALRLSGMMGQSFVVQVIKRHRLDRFYKNNLWGYTKQDLKLAKQLVPLYFSVPTGIKQIQKFLPGEELAVEKFGVVSVLIGPNFDPLKIPKFKKGSVKISLDLNFGLRVAEITGHFRTTFIVKDNHKVRVILANATQTSLGLSAYAGGDAKVGQIGVKSAFINARRGKVDSDILVEDLEFDISPEYKDARKALNSTFFGDFKEAKRLADLPSDQYAGVRRYAHAEVVQKSKERWLKLPKFNSRFDQSLIDENTELHASNTSQRQRLDAVEPVVEKTYQVNYVRKTWFEKKHLVLGLQDDLTQTDPLLSRSFSLDLDTLDKKTTRDELNSMLRAGRFFAPEKEKQLLTQWLEELPQDQKLKVRADLYVDFDAKAVATILAMIESERVPKFYLAWAKLLELDDWGLWGDFNQEERRYFSRQESKDVYDHYMRVEAFARAIQYSLRNIRLKDKQAADFIKGLGSMKYDPYPIAALAAITDQTHLLAEFRISIKGKGFDSKTLEYSNRGNNYQPRKLGYFKRMLGLL